MGKGITRFADNSNGHDNCSSVPWDSGTSPSVFANGRSIGIVGTAGESHGCNAHSNHKPIIKAGSTTVFATGKAIARINDPCDCGDKVKVVSINVFAGDSPNFDK